MTAELLPELQFADDLLEKIHRETEGRYRLIMDALAIVEREARRNKVAQVTAEMTEEAFREADGKCPRPFKLLRLNIELLETCLPQLGFEARHRAHATLANLRAQLTDRACNITTATKLRCCWII